MISRICANCRKEFYIKKPSEANRPNRKCCSRGCATTLRNLKRYEGIGLTKVCKECGKSFFAKYAGERKKRFCDKSCHRAWRNKHIPQNENQRKMSGERARKRFLGRKVPREQVLKQAKTISGSGHWNWQGGKSGWNILMRSNLKYKEWRKAVFERDHYICQICGKKGNDDLNADHILPLSLCPEKAYDISNGRTLCESCHKNTPTFSGKIKKWALTQGYGKEWGPIARKVCD